MNIANPYMFYLIWLVLLLMAVMIYGIRKRTRVLEKFMDTALFSVMIPRYSLRRRWLKGVLMILSLLLTVLALAGPQVGFRWEKVEQKGVDIMVALDCSRSMLATDIKPSRLEQAKREIIDLMKMMQSDRAGLVAFAGSAILQCPLTLDHSAFHIFLKALDPDYLPRGGTDIRGALQTALDGFETDVNSEKAIILITDGENTSGDPFEVVKEASKQGVRIFCIGVGREEGAPVPDASGGFKKDDKGRIIMSKVDDAALNKIADMGMGLYVKSVAGDMDLDLIYTREILKNMEKTTLQSGRKKVWENRFQWLLFPAVLLLMVELFLSEQKKDNDQNHKKSGVLFLLILCPIAAVICLYITPARAGTHSSVKKGIEAFNQGEYEKARKNFIDAQLKSPDMPELYYNIGSAAYKAEDYDSALTNFTRAMDTEDPLLKDKSRFNLGNTKYRKGDLEGAVEAFGQIGKGSELFQKASENMAFVKKRIEEQKQQQDKQDNQDKNSDENKDQKSQENKDQKSGENKDQKSGDKDKKQPQNQESSDKGQSGDNKEKNKIAGEDSQDSREQNSAKKPDKQSGEKDDAEQESGEEESQSANEQQTAEEEGDGDDDQSGTPENGSVDPRNKGNQRILNRLEDKPGSAMMPVYSGQPVGKDW